MTDLHDELDDDESHDPEAVAPAPAELPPAPTLNGAERKYLRGLSHNLEALVHVGQHGVTEAVIHAVSQALKHHELIKVRMHQPGDKKGEAAALAEGARAALCGLVGHTAILYRPHPTEPEIALPRRRV